MARLFNKTFFKFAFGFIGVIAVALVGVLLLGAYQMSTEPELPIESTELLAK